MIWASFKGLRIRLPIAKEAEEPTVFGRNGLWKAWPHVSSCRQAIVTFVVGRSVFEKIHLKEVAVLGPCHIQTHTKNPLDDLCRAICDFLFAASNEVHRIRDLSDIVRVTPGQTWIWLAPFGSWCMISYLMWALARVHRFEVRYISQNSGNIGKVSLAAKGVVDRKGISIR